MKLETAVAHNEAILRLRELWAVCHCWACAEHRTVWFVVGHPSSGRSFTYEGPFVPLPSGEPADRWARLLVLWLRYVVRKISTEG